MADNGAIEAFLLDDQEIVRRGLRDLVKAKDDLVVIGESGSAREAERIIPALRPQVAVLDARLVLEGWAALPYSWAMALAETEVGGPR
jgi:DNA-binding NarL/FixJ family response regulator